MLFRSLYATMLLATMAYMAILFAYGKPEWRNGTPGAEIAPPVEDPASS